MADLLQFFCPTLWGKFYAHGVTQAMQDDPQTDWAIHSARIIPYGQENNVLGSLGIDIWVFYGPVTWHSVGQKKCTTGNPNIFCLPTVNNTFL